MHIVTIYTEKCVYAHQKLWNYLYYQMYDFYGYKWSKSFMYKIAYYSVTSDKEAAKKKKNPKHSTEEDLDK